MTKVDFPVSPQAQGRRTWSRLRWMATVLILSVLLHIVAIDWATGGIRMPSPAETPVAVVATLIAAPQPVVPPAPVPKPQPKTRPRVIRETPPAAVETPPADDAPVISASDASPPADVVRDDAKSSQTNAEPSVKTADPLAERYRIDLPPSANLEYDVQRSAKDSQPLYGRGSIKWQTDGSHYSVDGDAGVLFFTVLNFRSEGTIDSQGIAPEIYSEKKFRKAETATHFQRERNVITFSASTRSYPRTGGEQDRASVIWQLAGIGRGGTDKFIAGTRIDLSVAGTRDLDTWSMMVVGAEDIVIAGESVHAWHVTRVPRPGSYDQTLDIWLAPHYNWYPVRLRYTETNGDFLDMSLSHLNLASSLGEP